MNRLKGLTLSCFCRIFAREILHEGGNIMLVVLAVLGYVAASQMGVDSWLVLFPILCLPIMPDAFGRLKALVSS